MSIGGIIFTQVYWVRKAFDIRENQFNRDVTSALGNVARKIFEINKTPSSANNPVTQISTNYFIVLVNGPIDASVLEFLLISEFEKRNITSEFEYGTYNCTEKCMVGGNYIAPNKTRMISQFPETPKLKTDGYYFAVQFPRLEANLLSQMGIWGFSSAVMMMVISFFVYTLLVILKQRRLSEVQKDFINNMTHEFKTPISTIAISSEVLKDPGIIKTPERLLNYATIIQTENQRLKQQVDRVLQMAQLDKETIDLNKEAINLNHLVAEVVKNDAIAIEACEGTVILNLGADQSVVKIDKLHFTNVVYNLLDNAIKYNHKKPEIKISSQNQNGKFILTITDNGIGIPMEEHKKIFQKFYRVPTGNIHDVKGFGLGLNYVKLIIENHDGKISLVSEAGNGSSFIITLPLSK